VRKKLPRTLGAAARKAAAPLAPVPIEHDRQILGELVLASRQIREVLGCIGRRVEGAATLRVLEQRQPAHPVRLGIAALNATKTRRVRYGKRHSTFPC
jgi:hypothetical protein